MMALLKIEDVTVAFGGLLALEKININVNPGTITALIGPNGAGKTTLLNVITGSVRPRTGKILFEGKEITGIPAYTLVGMGLTRTFQLTNVFPNLTVLDNLMLGSYVFCRPWKELLNDIFARRDPALAAARASVDEVLEFTGLLPYRDLKARQLPYGQQRLLELGIALAAKPRLLLLDEPAAGMNEEETKALAGLLGRIRANKVTILLVEHNMRLITNICDDAYVLVHGRNITAGPPRQILQDPQVIEAYLGRRKHA
ncbi:MAG TPA: ABC transporter ATP-binding protein [Negativicutes bacterium]|nr:ABC transporter ATP-binding protein [Negativicutes bacterium]